jgi:hypothetical protein
MEVALATYKYNNMVAMSTASGAVGFLCMSSLVLFYFILKATLEPATTPTIERERE